MHKFGDVETGVVPGATVKSPFSRGVRVASPLLRAALLLAAVAGDPQPAQAQDFSAPRLVEDDEDTQPTRKKKKGKKGKAQDDEDPGEGGAQDDGSTVEFSATGKPRTRQQDALQEADPDVPPQRPGSTPPGGREPRPAVDAGIPSPPPAPAATPDAGKPATPEPRTPPPPANAAAQKARVQDAISVRSPTLAELTRDWDVRRLEAIRDPAAGQRALLAVMSSVRAMGGGDPFGASAPDLATALALESADLLERLETERALVLADAAVMLAPDMALPRLAVFQARRVRDPGNVGSWGTALLDAFRAEARTLTSQVHGLFVLLASLLLASQAVLVAVAVTLLARRARLLQHDVGHVLPAHMRGLANTGLLAVVLVLPVALDAGPAVAALWWLAWSWRYLQGLERGAAVSAGLVASLAPLAIPFITPLLLAHRTEPAQAHAAIHDLGRGDAWLAAHSGPLEDPLLMATRGTLRKRRGQLPEARADLEAALRADGSAAWVHNNMGCVLAGLGEGERAVAAFERAAEADPTQPLYLHNAATMNTLLGRVGAARAAWEGAEALDHARVAALRDRSGSGNPRPHNQVVLDAPMPVGPVWKAAFMPGEESARVADAAWALVSPRVPRAAFPLVGIGMVILVALSGFLLRKGRPASACSRCESPACRACDGKETDGRHCSQCYNAFVAKGAKVEAALKIRKDVQIRRQRARNAWISRLATMLWPGTGLLYAGAALSGLVILVVFSACAMMGLSAWTWVPDPHAVGNALVVMRVALVAVPAVLAWLVGVVLAFRAEG